MASLVKYLTFTLMVIGCGVACTSSVCGQSRTHPYLGAPMISLQQRLSVPAQPLAAQSFESMMGLLSSAYEIPIWIDRFVVRDRVVIGKVEPEETLGSFLDRLAEQVDSVVVLLEGMVLIAPEKKGSVLRRTVWDLQVANLTSVWRKQESELGWPSGTPMQEVAKTVSHRLGWKEDWSESLEHDLWPSFEFKKVPRWSIAMCVLSSMDHTLEWREGKIQIIPLSLVDAHSDGSASERVEWIYTARQIDELGNAHCRLWKERCPTASIERVAGDGWRILATPDEHRRLVKPLVPKAKWSVPKPSEARYSGTVQGRLGETIQSLAVTLKIDFYPLPLPEAIADREVRVEYRNATLDQLLRDLGKAGNVEFVPKGGKFEIRVLP